MHPYRSYRPLAPWRKRCLIKNQGTLPLFRKYDPTQNDSIIVIYESYYTFMIIIKTSFDSLCFYVTCMCTIL